MRLHSAGTLRILDFDIENRPLSYLGMDFTTADITAIAASWADKTNVDVWLLGPNTTEEILEGFVDLYEQADIVTGHYIRNHDLPLINGALIECGMRPLRAKLTSDTKNDLIRRKGISVSQESLGDLLEVPAPKVQMSQKKWRAGNRLEPWGIEETRKRVVGDVKQHKLMRVALLKAGLLKPPRTWCP